MSDRLPARSTDNILWGIFIVALVAHGWLVTRNWTSGFMPGHEFRQAQTAITSYYIDQQDNFSLLYETPILGKPWVSILMEVPLYEWSVVLLSRATGLPHYMAARTVSAACFYLMLPALYLLLGRGGVRRPHRLLTLALVLTCPVYIFYSRAFLMESMELLCCAWFLLGFVRMMDRRRWYWFLFTAAAGTGAALIKGTTLAVWLLPAAGFGAHVLWRDLRARSGWRAPSETVFWGLAGVAVPLGALRLWIELTDPLKSVHASAWIFTSKNLSQGNWGLADVAARFSAGTWGVLADRWREAVMPPWLLLSGLVAGLLLLPRMRAPALALASVFFLAQLMFPFAYAYQDYYFYACAVFLLAGYGFLLQGVLDSRLPRWASWVLLAVPFGAQLHTYGRGYYPQQVVVSDGGFSFTEVLRDLVPRESVIIVAGADWAAMIPFYAQHKALMIRNGLENDPAYLDRALAELGDEDVAALVLAHGQQANQNLINRVTTAFDLDPTSTFSHAAADVYCSRRYSSRVRAELERRLYYGGSLKPGPAVPVASTTAGPFRISGGLARTAFAMVSPAPIRGNFAFGFDPIPVGDATALFAHPDCQLWLTAPSRAVEINWDYGIIADAYDREGDKTDGVEFTITGFAPNRPPRVLFNRYLDPARAPADRGLQRLLLPYQPLPGEILLFSCQAGEGKGYDWSYWARIDVR